MHVCMSVSANPALCKCAQCGGRLSAFLQPEVCGRLSLLASAHARGPNGWSIRTMLLTYNRKARPVGLQRKRKTGSNCLLLWWWSVTSLERGAENIIGNLRQNLIQPPQMPAVLEPVVRTWVVLLLRELAKENVNSTAVLKAIRLEQYVLQVALAVRPVVLATPPSATRETCVICVDLITNTVTDVLLRLCMPNYFFQ